MSNIAKIRRTLLLVSLITFIIAVILLLNFTASNPTGRRYSSEMPLTTGQDDSTALGNSAERILARDLNLPRNEDPDQRQCICNSPGVRSVAECRVCVAYSQSIATYRRPDFVAPGYIAESKNRQNLLYTDRGQLDQIGDYAIAARALARPLWVYTRVDTNLDPEFYRIVESTGGGIVHYFTVPGYVDRVDSIARPVALTSIGLFILFLIWEFPPFSNFGRSNPSPRRPSGGGGGRRGTGFYPSDDEPPGTPDPKPRRPRGPGDRGSSIEAGIRDLEERARRRIDDGDARDGFDDDDSEDGE